MVPSNDHVPDYNTRSEYEEALGDSRELQREYNVLSRAVDPVLDPNERRGKRILHACWGVKLARQKKKAIRLEREILLQERDAGVTTRVETRNRLWNADHRYLSVGEDLWRHLQTRSRLGSPDDRPFIDARSGSATACLMALYLGECGHLDKMPAGPPSKLSKEGYRYYAGRNHTPHVALTYVWCHVTARWWEEGYAKAVHMVPFILTECNGDDMGEILFGSRTPSIKQGGNVLLLSANVRKWLDAHDLVIVPADASETPITRWRTDAVSDNLRGSGLDGKELTFLNENRPVPRFMYFRFVLSLVRMRDMARPGWQEVWAKYHETPPFPTAGYVSKSVLTALATHFGATPIGSWITRHGIDTPLKLTEDEATEVARRVLLALEEEAIYEGILEEMVREMGFDKYHEEDDFQVEEDKADWMMGQRARERMRRILDGGVGSEEDSEEGSEGDDEEDS
ncbi:hypothetical protein QBC39DRAFT_348700 [Podospora conica]|nr:hypothetical protein QBC39DRAFT_348700 [Schizothecium conicum]